MSSHAPPRQRWLALALWAAACGDVGTPTPEPPDHLPRPELAWPASGHPPSAPGEPGEPMGASAAPVQLEAMAGSVQGGTEVWLVNLDRPVAPVTVRASAAGAFSATILDSEPGDRVRVISRLGNQHSLPLDLKLAPPGIREDVPERIACLALSPADELTGIVGDRAITARIRLDNRCAREVVITTARLRFASAGFTLEPPPARIPASARVELVVRIDAHAQPTAQADILLLELAQGDARGRYALGLWSISASSLGRP